MAIVYHVRHCLTITACLSLIVYHCLVITAWLSLLLMLSVCVVPCTSSASALGVIAIRDALPKDSAVRLLPPSADTEIVCCTPGSGQKSSL
jgi:hypothetical protein